MVKSKTNRTLLKTALPSKDCLTQIICKFECRKSMTITAWILGFDNNCKKNRHKYSKPLTIEELQIFFNLRVSQIQNDMQCNKMHKHHKGQLKLVKSENVVFVCKVRITSFIPISLPTYSIFTKKGWLILIGEHYMEELKLY